MPSGTRSHLLSKNFNQAIRTIDLSNAPGITDPFPAMGPFPVADSFGMKPAAVLLLKSLDVGKYAPTVQFSTMRKMRSAFSNVYLASAAGYCGTTVMAKDTRTLLVTDCPTYGTWFDHFVRGCHKRMGGIVKPDRALSLAILHQIMLILEEDWLKSYQSERYKFAREACFYFIAFCGALRGEEVPMANLTGTLKH